MKIAKDNLENLINYKLKGLDKKSLLKENNLMNVNQLRIKQNVIINHLLPNMNYNNKRFQKNLYKSTIEKEIKFKRQGKFFNY